MITAEEFVLEINDTEQSKNFKLANVVDLFENNTAKVMFDGEDAASEKQYAYLESYTPEIFDRVLLAVTGGTYVILGKVNYNISPPTVEELDRYLFDQKIVTMTQGLSLTGGASIAGNVGVNGNITGTNLSMTGNITASGQLQAGSISTAGVLNASGGGTLDGTFTFSDTPIFSQGISANVTFWNTMRYLNVTHEFKHSASNGQIGFFGVNTSGKKTVAPFPNPSNVTLLQAVQGINNIVNALKAYGLL